MTIITVFIIIYLENKSIFLQNDPSLHAISVQQVHLIYRVAYICELLKKNEKKNEEGEKHTVAITCYQMEIF